MSDIAKLYEEVMSSGTDKTAADINADAGPAFDATFFQKVASGEEEAVQALSEFIEEAKAEGHSEDEIEEAIGEAMVEAGVETKEAAENEDEYEVQKAAAYAEGASKAIEDVLDSDLAKTAGVTVDDLVEYELGGFYGTGYAETRKTAEEVVTKIAAAKREALEKEAAEGKSAKALGKGLIGKLKGAAGRYSELMRGGQMGAGNSPAALLGKAKRGVSKEQAQALTTEARKSLATRAATGVGVAGGIGAAAMAAKNRK